MDKKEMDKKEIALNSHLQFLHHTEERYQSDREVFSIT